MVAVKQDASPDAAMLAHKSDAAPTDTVVEVECDELNHELDVVESPPRSPISPISKDDARERLAELRSRKQDGSLTTNEYKDAKKALLDRLAISHHNDRKQEPDGTLDV